MEGVLLKVWGEKKPLSKGVTGGREETQTPLRGKIVAMLVMAAVPGQVRGTKMLPAIFWQAD